MDGWWLIAEGAGRKAVPVHGVTVQSYDNVGSYCGFTKHGPNAVLWCTGDLERIAAAEKQGIVYCSFTDTTFWKAP